MFFSASASLCLLIRLAQAQQLRSRTWNSLITFSQAAVHFSSSQCSAEISESSCDFLRKPSFTQLLVL